MKKTRKITRVKLQIDQIDDFILFGLVSSEPDYKLCLALNKKFRISLKSISPLKLNGDKETELLFSRFSDSGESPDRIFNLVSNRSGKNFLLGKLRNVDYILQLHDALNELTIDQITSSLREIPCITAVFNIDMESVKDKNLHLVIQ
jgi:hypothetical protein